MSHPRWISCAAAVVLFTALVSLVSPLHAQQQETWVRYDTCWRYFDSSQTRFLIGAVDMKFPLLARELGIDFTKLYGLPNPANLWSIIQNPGAGALTVNDSATRLLDTLVRNLWLAADTTGYRVVSRFPNTSEVIYATRRLETYLWDNRWAQMFHALERFFGNDETSYFAVVPEADRDTVMHGMVYAATMRDSTNHTLKLVGAGVRYAAKELFHLGNRHLYKAIGSPERTTMFRVSVAMKVAKDSVAQGQFNTLDDTTELARIVVYRRARQGQIIPPAPRAWIYEPFDTVVIRKADYINDKVITVEDGYRELGATIDMKRSQQVLLHDTVVYLPGCVDPVIPCAVTLSPATIIPISIPDPLPIQFPGSSTTSATIPSTPISPADQAPSPAMILSLATIRYTIYTFHSMSPTALNSSMEFAHCSSPPPTLHRHRPTRSWLPGYSLPEQSLKHSLLWNPTST